MTEITTADSVARRAPAGPNAVPTERRTRKHFRELCDEVLASFRVARGRDLWTDRERSDAHALLRRLAPATHV